MIDILFEVGVSGLLQGLILAILVLGVMIPFKLLNLPDITSEGSFPLGGCAYAVLLTCQLDPLLSILIATTIAGLGGVCTAAINIKYKINSLLAGIIVSTMLYSVNLRMMGKSNLILPELSNFFTDAISNVNTNILVTILLNLIFIAAVFFFLKTEKGLRFRSVGLNQRFAQKQGISLNKNIVFGLFIANCLAGVAGIIFVQTNNYADIGMSVGIIIQALAAMLIGEKVLGTESLLKIILAPFVGAIIYQQIQGFALLLGLAPSDLKFMTGAIVLFIISLPSANNSSV